MREAAPNVMEGRLAMEFFFDESNGKRANSGIIKTVAILRKARGGLELRV